MAVSTTSGIHDDLHLRNLGTQIDGNVRSPVRPDTVASPDAVVEQAAPQRLDGEAVLALDVWHGAAAGSRPLHAGGAHAPATAGVAPRAAIDATAAHVLAAFG